MYRIAKILKSTAAKVTLVILILLSLLCVFFFWGWFERQIHKGIGMYYVHQGDKAYKKRQLEEAIRKYKIGLRHYPGHSLARCNLGNIYVKYEDYYSAVDEYAKALKYDPKYIVCRMNLGIVSAEKLVDYDTAIREYETILETKRFTFHIPFIFNSVKSTKDNKSIAWYNMGVAYRGKSLLMGEKTYLSDQYLLKAAECYKKALKRQKNVYDVNYNYAVVNYLLGNYKESGRAYCKAIEIEPMAFDAHYNYALLLQRIKKYPESLVELQKAALVGSGSNDPYISQYLFNVMLTVIEKYAAVSEDESGQHPEMQYGKQGFMPEELLKKDKRKPHINTEVIEDTDNPLGRSYITYVNGKVVASGETDKFIKSSFSKCTGRQLFYGSEKGKGKQEKTKGKQGKQGKGKNKDKDDDEYNRDFKRNERF